jgi:hypothetical protein
MVIYKEQYQSQTLMEVTSTWNRNFLTFWWRNIALQTEKILGYPAYDEDKFVIGFFSHLTPSISLGYFTPIEQLKNEFDHADQMKAAYILSKAIESRCKTFYCITDFESLQSLMEAASSNNDITEKSV